MPLGAAAGSGGCGGHERSYGIQLRSNPFIGCRQSLFERRGRLPVQGFEQQAVIAVPAPHALRLSEIVALPDVFSRNAGNRVDQLVDRYQIVCPQIQRVRVFGPHDPVDTLDAVGNVAVRAGLASVAPHLDRVAVGSQSDLTANGGGRVLAASVVCAQWSVDVLGPDDAGIPAKIFTI